MHGYTSTRHTKRHFYTILKWDNLSSVSSYAPKQSFTWAKYILYHRDTDLLSLVAHNRTHEDSTEETETGHQEKNFFYHEGGQTLEKTS